MEVKPGYKQTEVGVIPEEWEVKNLSDVSRKITDGDHVTPKRTSQGYYLLSARNVLNGRIDVADVDYVGAAEYQRMKQRCCPEAGDILISCSGTIGRVTVVPAGFECVLVRSAALAKIDHELADGVFLQFWLQGSKAQGQIASSVNQGAQPNLFLNHIERLACPHPPLPEQRAIATALSDVDALLAALDHLIAKQRDLKQAAMQQLLTGQTRLPGFKGEWQATTLGDLVVFMSGGTPSRSNADYWAGTIPWISASSLRCFYIFRSDSNVTKQAVKAGSKMAPVDSTLLLVRGSALHNEILSGLVTAPVCFNQDVKALVPTSRIVPIFLTLLMHGKSDMLLKLVSSAGNTAGVLDTKLLKAFEIFLPSLPEQTAIAAVLKDMDAALTALEQRRDKTRALKQGMMQELLTGRTRLPGNAEPQLGASMKSQ